jgi:hypothetical protein
MNTRQKLIQAIEQTPDAIIEEVLNFLLSTQSRHQQNITPNNTPLIPNKPSPDKPKESRPIWELFQETAETIPEEILQNLPNDGAQQHDHYLYGTSKRGIDCWGIWQSCERCRHGKG